MMEILPVTLQANALLQAILLSGFVFVVLLWVAFCFRYWKGPYIKIKGKHVCITGGSEGIGLCISQECIRRGAAAVTLIARDPRKLKIAVELLAETAAGIGNNEGPCDSRSKSTKIKESEAAPHIRAFACDVTNAESVKRVFDVINRIPCQNSDGTQATTAGAEEEAGTALVMERHSNSSSSTTGPVDVLVNCAGTCICDDFDALLPDELENQLRLNVCGTLYPCRELFKFVKEQNGSAESSKRRAIVLVGSLASQLNIFGFVAYGASKFAIRGLWEALTMECEPFNIRVISAFPPSTDTPGFEIECRRKPEITKIIEDTSGLYSAENVALKIVDGIERGSRRVTFGFMGWLLAALTSGFSPASDAFEVISDLFVIPLARLIAVALSFYWRLLVHKHHKLKNRDNKKLK